MLETKLFNNIQCKRDFDFGKCKTSPHLFTVERVEGVVFPHTESLYWYTEVSMGTCLFIMYLALPYSLKQLISTERFASRRFRIPFDCSSDEYFPATYLSCGRGLFSLNFDVYGNKSFHLHPLIISYNKKNSMPNHGLVYHFHQCKPPAGRIKSDLLNYPKVI